MDKAVELQAACGSNYGPNCDSIWGVNCGSGSDCGCIRSVIVLYCN